jgi:O-antigen/teichoic acid export membrane protein/glycosyltransferase involved in cell wall biosynthesis
MAKGVGWMVMLRMADRVLGVISFSILARLLLPEHFGLVALAVSLSGLLEILGEFSVELALIRDPRADRRLYDTAWTMKIMRGLVVAGILALLAPLVAGFFGEPRVEAVVYCLALARLIQSFENIGVVEFRKALTFNKEFTYLFLSRCLSTVLALAFAVMWRNYWALVGGILAQKSTQVALSFVVHEYRPTWSLTGFRELFHFSKWMVIQNFVHGLNLQAPTWVIGQLAGVGAVAHYAVGSEIATLTTSELRAPIRRAMFPGFAKLASDPQALQNGFLDAYGLMVLIGLPIPMGLAVAAPFLVHVFLGDQWQAAVPVIEVLALYGVVQAVGSSSHLVYLALNRPQITARLAGLHFGLLLPLLVAGVSWAGAVGAAWALTITSIIVLLVDFRLILRMLDIPLHNILATLARPVGGSLAMLAGLISLRLIFPEPQSWISSALQLVALSGTGVIVYAGAVLTLWHLTGRPYSAENRVLSVLRDRWERYGLKGKKAISTSHNVPIPTSHSQRHNSVPSVIVFGMNEWGDIWHTRQHISSRLGKRGWSVVYTTGTGDMYQRGEGAWLARSWQGSYEEKDHVILYRSGKLDARWPKLKRWNRRALRRHTRELMDLAGWSTASTRIAYVFHPSFWPYVEHLDDCTVVYHTDDAFSLMPGWNAKAQEMQAKLVARADLLLATSPGMARLLPNGGASRARHFPNGADVRAYMDAAQYPCPTDLAAIPCPRIGYTGSVNIKVDLLLVAQIAQRRPDWHWVIIGPVRKRRFEGFPGNAEFQAGLAACEQLPNVHFLGAKPYHVLPAYVTHMDVNTMCYQNVPGGWWTAIYPLKLHEYLAAGKPVVSNKLEVLREFPSTVAIAETVEEWVTALEAAINAGGVGTKQGRQTVALQHTWESRIEELVGWLGEAVRGRRDRDTHASTMRDPLA